jgi:hypothetical protein
MRASATRGGAYGLVPADEPLPFKPEVPPSCASIYQGGAARGPSAKARAFVALGTHVPTVSPLLRPRTTAADCKPQNFLCLGGGGHARDPSSAYAAIHSCHFDCGGFLPPGPSRSNWWPLELCYGLLKYCRWRLGNQDGCPGGGDRWLCKANHQACAYIKGGRGGGPPYPCIAFTLTLRILPTAWLVAFTLLCFLRPAPFSLPSPLAFFGGGFSLYFLRSSSGCLLRSLQPSPWR